MMGTASQFFQGGFGGRVARLGRFLLIGVGLVLLAGFFWGLYTMARGTTRLTDTNILFQVARLFFGLLCVLIPGRWRKPN